MIDEDTAVAASGIHYLTSAHDRLLIMLNYKRAFFKDWKRMEEAVRDVLAHNHAEG